MFSAVFKENAQKHRKIFPRKYFLENNLCRNIYTFKGNFDVVDAKISFTTNHF